MGEYSGKDEAEDDITERVHRYIWGANAEEVEIKYRPGVGFVPTSMYFAEDLAGRQIFIGAFIGIKRGSNDVEEVEEVEEVEQSPEEQLKRLQASVLQDKQRRKHILENWNLMQQQMTQKREAARIKAEDDAWLATCEERQREAEEAQRERGVE